MDMQNFTCANYGCRPEENIKGAGGGGRLIIVHYAKQCVTGYATTSGAGGEMGHRSRTIFPKCDYGQPLKIAGVYRPPGRNRPRYEGAMGRILRGNISNQVTTLVEGDLNATFWKNENKNRAEEAGMWELLDPWRPNFEKGATPDAMALAPGKHSPEAISPLQANEENMQKATEIYPANVAESRVLGSHIALFLTSYEVWPDLQNKKRQYNEKTSRKKNGRHAMMSRM